MALPINLLLVRHGQSEGNLAKRHSEKGDHSAFTQEFKDRHSASFRLTELGRAQARATGMWLQKEFPYGFDRYYTSEYIRAKETAALLGLASARWFCDFYITERDWGNLDIVSEEERQKKFADALRQRKNEPFFWRPPNGQSFADLCLRIDRLLHTFHRECSDKNVITVCHGEVMRAFQVRIERMSQERFRELTFTENPLERIYNCQVIHYTRRNPQTGALSPYADWVRIFRPGHGSSMAHLGRWQEIVRPKYSNENLLDIVSRVKPMVV